MASSVEMLSRARRKDYAAETAAAALEAQARPPATRPTRRSPMADESGFSVAPGADGDEDDEEDELLEEAVAA